MMPMLLSCAYTYEGAHAEPGKPGIPTDSQGNTYSGTSPESLESINYQKIAINWSSMTKRISDGYPKNFRVNALEGFKKTARQIGAQGISFIDLKMKK